MAIGSFVARIEVRYRWAFRPAMWVGMFLVVFGVDSQRVARWIVEQCVVVGVKFDYDKESSPSLPPLQASNQ